MIFKTAELFAYNFITNNRKKKLELSNNKQKKSISDSIV